MDDLVMRLQSLRERAGAPSYADIATAVSRVRRERGLSPEQSRIGRTTVYDAFRLGRRRLDPALVSDIVRALGVPAEEAESWSSAARTARAAADLPGPDLPVPALPVPDLLVPDLSAPEEPAVETPAPAAATGPSWRVLAAVLVACLGANLVGRAVVDALELPVYLDMMGTAFAAIVVGPWWGALVGVTTNLAGVPLSGPESIPFALVNVAGALVWGYGVRRWSFGRSVPRFFALNVLVALACTLVAVPIIVAMDGVVGHGADRITATALALVHSLWAAVAVSNLLSSVADKLIAGFVSLTLIESLPPGLRDRVPRVWMRGESDGTAVRACSGTPEPA